MKNLFKEVKRMGKHIFQNSRAYRKSRGVQGADLDFKLYCIDRKTERERAKLRFGVYK